MARFPAPAPTVSISISVCTPRFRQRARVHVEPKTKGLRKMGNEIRIYAACLAAYNNGILHGKWVNALQSTDDIISDVQKMLKQSPIPNAEEWAIHDYEGFNGLSLSEYEGFEAVTRKADFIEEHGTLGAKVAEYFGDIDDAIKALTENYYGEYTSLADYAEQQYEDMVSIPDCLRNYIDYESLGRDLAINDVFTIETGFNEIHIFSYL